MNRTLARVTAAVVVLALLPMANWLTAQTSTAAEPLQVVASFSILGDLVHVVERGEHCGERDPAMPRLIRAWLPP